MASHSTDPETVAARREQIVAAYQDCGGNVSETARRCGVARITVMRHVAASGASKDKPLASGTVLATRAERRPPPRSGVRRYLLTSAQNNTPVWEPVLKNLRAAQDFYEAELLCASFTYNQNAYGDLSVKRGTKKSTGPKLWYDPQIEGLLDGSDRDIELAPGLIWCGRANTLPTAKNPLAGFETYTGVASGIFPHAKVAMKSIAQARGQGAKFNYTTGTVTQRNYIQKTAGMKAEFHHIYGGLIVEVMPSGEWYVRQLAADKSGAIIDLDVKFEDGKAKRGHYTEAISWGDVHVAECDPHVRELAWGEGGMLDDLRPRYQFLHDTLDFRSRNHHDRGNPHLNFAKYVEGVESVEDECSEVAEFLGESLRPWCKSVVVDSNHDGALGKWLREADYRTDPVNAIFFLRNQLVMYQAIKDGDKNHHVVERALRDLGCPEEVRFLREDESFLICESKRGNAIECGAHGHLGPDGSRGAPGNLSRQGRRSNTGHSHSACIIDGQYVAGACVLNPAYARGPSSWSWTHTVTYQNGKRAQVTMRSDYRGRG